MRRLFLFILLAAGFVFANEAYKTQATDRENRLAAVTRILTTPGLNLAGIDPASGAGASSTLAHGVTVIATDLNASAASAMPPQPAPARLPDSANDDARRVALLNTEAAPIAVAAVTVPSPSPAWPAAVADTPSTIGGQPGPRTMSRPALIRAIQLELKRVNCYRGPLDGSWGLRSKRALQAFIERVNASLPTTAPDLFQLTLIQSQQYPVCGDRCPKGQSFSREGQCVPDAILARANKRQTVAELIAGNSRETTLAAPSVIAFAGQTSAKPEAAAELVASPRAAARQPLPGRMSIGGPVEATTPAAPAPSGPVNVAALDGANSGGPWQAPDEAPGRAGALEDYDVPDGQAETVSPTGDDVDGATLRSRQGSKAATVLRPSARASAPPRARAASKPQRSRLANYRSRAGRNVQSLFTNPLGR